MYRIRGPNKKTKSFFLCKLFQINFRPFPVFQIIYKTHFRLNGRGGGGVSGFCKKYILFLYGSTNPIIFVGTTLKILDGNKAEGYIQHL